jgi:hypothetical protein
MPQTPDPDFLGAALLGYQEILKQIESRITELRQKLNMSAPEPRAVAVAPATGERRLSPAGRVNIVAALKKRWAAAKKAKVAASQPAKPKPSAQKDKGPQQAPTRAGRKATARAVKRTAAPTRAARKRGPKMKVVERIGAEARPVVPVAVEPIATVQVAPVAVGAVPEMPVSTALAATA